MEYAPLVLLAMGFWQISSQELLPYKDTKTNWIHVSNESRETNHTWFLFTTLEGISKYSGPALPMFILLWIMIFQRIFSYIFRSLKTRYQQRFPKKNDLEVEKVEAQGKVGQSCGDYLLSAF